MPLHVSPLLTAGENQSEEKNAAATAEAAKIKKTIILPKENASADEKRTEPPQPAENIHTENNLSGSVKEKHSADFCSLFRKYINLAQKHFPLCPIVFQRHATPPRRENVKVQVHQSC